MFSFCFCEQALRQIVSSAAIIKTILFIFVNAFYGFCTNGFSPFTASAAVTIVEVDEYIAGVTHAQLFHVRQLAQSVAGLDTLHHIVVLLGGHGIDDVDASLVDGQDVG